MQPNFNIMLDALLRRRKPERIPLYEHIIDPEVIQALQKLGYGRVPSSQEEHLSCLIETYRALGYDYVPFELPIQFAQTTPLISQDTAELNRGNRGWMDENTGPIKTWADLENKDYWPSIDKSFDFEQFEAICSNLPDGMKIIGGASGGPFEHASFLMGLESLSLRVYEDPEFVEAMMEKIGTTLVGIAERLVQLDGVGAYRFGDDMGYKTSTMLSPDVLRQFFFPWAKKVVDVVHAAGKPFVLHSCGQLSEIMDDLIDDLGIDAKHSFEDVIMPVTKAKKQWGNRVAILGGVDVDYLCRHTPEEIKRHTLDILERCSVDGGYALGSGNTIANYIPIPNYLAMLEAWKEFNG